MKNGEVVVSKKNTNAVNDSMIALIHEIADVSSRILENEFRELMTKNEILEEVPKGMMTYICAAAFLSFSGRAINKSNISKLVTLLGIKPKNSIIDILLSTEIRSHLIYIYGFYFLLSNGIKPTEKKVLNIVASMGEIGNKKTVVEAFDLICILEKH